MVRAVGGGAAVQAAGPVDTAVDTGVAQATGGGTASTGVVRLGGTSSGSATAERTGDAVANGTESKSNTGVIYG